MKPLRQAIDDYIALRRSLGFKLCDMADDLRNFAAFLEQKAVPYVTTELAMEWAMQPADHQPSDWAQRLSFVRVFARHWQATDPRTEIPPTGLLPFRPRRARPYLYSELEIQQLLAAALKLSPSQGLRPRRVCVSARRSSWSRRMWILGRAFSPSAKRSSARPAWFRSTLPLGTSWPITPGAATGFYAVHRLPVSFSTITAAVWRALRFVEHSTICRGRSACADRTITRGHGFTIFGIVPTPRSCRLFARCPCRRRPRRTEIRHNQRLSKNASNWSSGRYRPGLTPRGGVRDSACSFNFMSACR
jgi:hypothetical protein